MASQGRKNEDEMVFFLNNRKISELSNNLKELIGEIYGVVDPSVVLKCTLAEDYIKPDILIDYNGIIKAVSLKCINGSIVHQERIDTFLNFLRGLGISDETIETLLLHQYGDGTTDGSGGKRMQFGELIVWLDERIKKANAELNQKEFLIPVMERALFQGVRSDAKRADAIYVGNYEKGICVIRKQFHKYFERKEFNFMKTLHIGPFMIRPHARYIDTEIVNEESRHRIDFLWYKMVADMEYINKKYDSYMPVRYRKEDND